LIALRPDVVLAAQYHRFHAVRIQFK
jgi:hypothetical protein